MRSTYLTAAAALLAALLTAALPRAALAQLKEAEPETEGVVFGEPAVGRFKVGAEITASRGAVKNIRAMVAVPLECAEQEVRIAEEEFSSEVDSVEYRMLNGDGARQMVINIPFLAAGATARAVVTYDVTTRPVLPPEDDQAAAYKIPEKPDRRLRRYLTASPYIESRHGTVRKLHREALAEADEDLSDWQRVELLYDKMLETIEYIEGDDKSALQTLRDGNADCHGRSAVFIALCRSAGVPARVVWVNNHCYAEFYLEDEAGEGRWFPAESAGSRAFGEMPLARVILQKGDSFTVPERRRDKLRYATDFMIGTPMPGSGQPKAKYIREQL
ncbi:transglutaminase-like domain-containing protein [Posidoniimonas polymericola]|uniref:transglutaminase-like domain-containing protein n=1 Tax=Posidoniimonas polymericola TaxID=2528002 RepID=UPI001E3AB3FC|nr:transglutaminase-like domain-containing protein [Posidoniimonas polymericola]